MLVVLPWSEFWEGNYFAAAWPLVRSIVTNNFVRGGVSGLGVVNLIVGFTDLALVITSRERSDMSVGDGAGPPLS